MIDFAYWLCSWKTFNEEMDRREEKLDRFIQIHRETPQEKANKIIDTAARVLSPDEYRRFLIDSFKLGIEQEKASKI